MEQPPATPRRGQNFGMTVKLADSREVAVSVYVDRRRGNDGEDPQQPGVYYFHAWDRQEVVFPKKHSQAGYVFSCWATQADMVEKVRECFNHQTNNQVVEVQVLELHNIRSRSKTTRQQQKASRKEKQTQTQHKQRPLPFHAATQTNSMVVEDNSSVLQAEQESSVTNSDTLQTDTIQYPPTKRRSLRLASFSNSDTPSSDSKLLLPSNSAEFAEGFLQNTFTPSPYSQPSLLTPLVDDTVYVAPAKSPSHSVKFLLSPESYQPATGPFAHHDTHALDDNHPQSSNSNNVTTASSRNTTVDSLTQNDATSSVSDFKLIATLDDQTIIPVAVSVLQYMNASDANSSHLTTANFEARDMRTGATFGRLFVGWGTKRTLISRVHEVLQQHTNGRVVSVTEVSKVPDQSRISSVDFWTETDCTLRSEERAPPQRNCLCINDLLDDSSLFQAKPKQQQWHTTTV